MADPGPTWGERMRKWLADQGWTQQELATRSGLSIGTVSNLYRGIVEPHPRTIRKIATALGKTPLQVLQDLPSSVPLTREEQELLRLYLRKSKRHQRLVITLLRDLPNAAAPKGSK